MAPSLGSSAREGLERSCGDWLRSRGPIGGVELLQAHFGGRGFAPHRHDTYGIAVTDLRLQTFDYRGSVQRSPLPAPAAARLRPRWPAAWAAYGRGGAGGGFRRSGALPPPVRLHLRHA